MVTLEDSLVIEAAEAEVVELYRSATPVALLIEGRPGPDAQAVACALRRDGRYLVYVALHLRNTNRALIYAIDQVAGGLPAFAAALQKANDFCGEMGFRMEPVGLRYSAAMREVILRQVPVLFPPQDAQKLALDRAAEIADLEQLVAELGAEETPAGQERNQNSDQQIEARQLRNARAAAARAAARKLAGEKRLDEQVQALRRGVEKYLTEINAPEAAAAETADRDQLLATLTAAQQRTAQLEGALQSLQEEVQAGRGERQKLTKTIFELQQALQRAEERVVAEAKKRQELETEEVRRQELERELEALQQARQSEAQTIGELEAAARQAQQRTAVAEEKTRALATAATADGVRLTKLEQELRQTTALLATQEAEHQRLRQAWDESEKDRLASAAAVDDRQLDSLQKELRQARAASEAERLRRQQLEEAQRTSEARLAELQLALEQAGSKALKAVAAPPAAVDSELPSLREALRQAEAEAELLHLENGRLAAAKAMAEQQLAQLQALGPLSEAAANKSETAPKRMGLGTLMLAKTDPGPPPHVVRRPPPAGAFFHVDWDLTAIPCQRVADLCEIHQSIGFAQLSIEGYPTQYCNAFIVVVKDGEQKRLFMPFRLSSSNRLLVYVPAEQPSSDGVLAKAMKEANRFLQVVGMETERVPLGRKGKLPPELEAILAIGTSTRNAGNF